MKRSVLALVLLVVATACGGNGDDGGSPIDPGPQPFNQTVTGTVSTFGTTFHPLSIPRSGNMTVRLQWTGNVDLDLYLTQPTCVQLYPMNSCGIIVAADGLANPETIARTVSAGEQFRLWVDNLSLSQSMTYTLTINIQ